ncbi:hypothetical protein ACODT4_44585 [Streptomyces sp. 2.9]|uniref:hypothetical protein n=1 Tax=Streptomyces tritrimontium TaxID=3406573 RepID=UPI003BB685D3
MTDFEPTAQACAAAARAYALAEIARRRTLFTSAWNGRALHVLADLLDIVALSFCEEEPTDADGIPADARLALADAETTADENPGTGFPQQFGQYVTHALDPRPLTRKATLGTTGCALGDGDTQLAAALDTLHSHLAAAASEEVAQALIEAVFVLHEKRAALASIFQS